MEGPPDTCVGAKGVNINLTAVDYHPCLSSTLLPNRMSDLPPISHLNDDFWSLRSNPFIILDFFFFLLVHVKLSGNPPVSTFDVSPEADSFSPPPLLWWPPPPHLDCSRATCFPTPILAIQHSEQPEWLSCECLCPSQILTLKPVPQWDSIGRCGLWEVIRFRWGHEGRDPGRD